MRLGSSELSNFFLFSSSAFCKAKFSIFLYSSFESSASYATFSEYRFRYSVSPSAISRADVAPIRESNPLSDDANWCKELPLITVINESYLEMELPTDEVSSSSSFLGSSSSYSIPKSLAASFAAYSFSSFSLAFCSSAISGNSFYKSTIWSFERSFSSAWDSSLESGYTTGSDYVSVDATVSDLVEETGAGFPIDTGAFALVAGVFD